MIYVWGLGASVKLKGLNSPSIHGAQGVFL
ncbi:hypothetical protein VP01_4191g4 [Puccinia sorghi]|uniref:Uncharacterized protein n=1 Tax=Puccinia sorghi TaxID=27349 RepID=A0A0L6UQT7_9BASI|nr:hypothetical protein VP01_4191g4 [Puccinia sorghi]